MIITEREVVVLKLLCWCQFVYPGDLACIASEKELENLEELLLIMRHDKSGAFRLTSRGYSYLADVISDSIPLPSKNYIERNIQRRLCISKLMVTSLKASVNIFTISPEQLTIPPSLLLSSTSRSDKQNPYGSNRVAALAHLGDRVFAIHYIYPHVGTIAYHDELKLLKNQAARLGNEKRGILYTGVNYQDILTELVAHSDDTDCEKVYYGQAYHRFKIPVHLLSCDDIGAMQLKIMSVPNYRSVFAQAALELFYTPPPDDAPIWDGLYKGVPFIMAADMNLRRVDDALELANDRGIKRIAIVGLEGQTDAVLGPLYQDTGKADVYTLKGHVLKTVLGDHANLYLPPKTQYLTEEGDVVDAPSIKAARKARGYHHK